MWKTISNCKAPLHSWITKHFFFSCRAHSCVNTNAPVAPSVSLGPFVGWGWGKGPLCPPVWACTAVHWTSGASYPQPPPSWWKWRRWGGGSRSGCCLHKGRDSGAVSVHVRKPALSGAICRGTDVYGDQLMKKVRCLFYLSPFQPAVFHIPVSHHKELRGTARRAYLPNTGVLYDSSELLVRWWTEVSCKLNFLISDLSSFMASGWVSRKPRSQKAAGPLLHWKENKRSPHYKS